MTSLKLIQLNFKAGGYNLLARVIINGKPALMMVDTSASRTVLDNDHVQKFVSQTELKRNPRRGLSSAKESVFSYVATIDKMEIGSVVINNFKATTTDLGEKNRSFRAQGNPQIDGLLGCDLLRHCKAVLRFEDRVLEMDSMEVPGNEPVEGIIEE